VAYLQTKNTNFGIGVYMEGLGMENFGISHGHLVCIIDY
jgi:hypothetical protein